MTGKPPSRQLGRLLGSVPPATAGGQPPRSLAVPYADPSAPDTQPKVVAALSVPDTQPEAVAAPSPAPVVEVEREVPIQVLVPERVKTQLELKRAREKKTMRYLTLEAFRAIGVDITDEELAGKRGRKKS